MIPVRDEANDVVGLRHRGEGVVRTQTFETDTRPPLGIDSTDVPKEVTGLRRLSQSGVHRLIVIAETRQEVFDVEAGQ